MVVVVKGVREHKRFISRNYEEGLQVDNKGGVRIGERYSRVRTGE